MKTLNFNLAGFHLTSLAMELYKSRSYRRGKAVLAQTLVDAALEAGRRVTEVHTYPANNRGPAAECALDCVSKLVFTVYLMKNEGIYTDSATAPVLQFAQTVKRELYRCISSEGRSVHPPKATPMRSFDVDGFYEKGI